MRTICVVTWALGLLGTGGAALAAEPVQGPSSSEPAYVVPTATGWTATSLITAGDGASQNGYRMVGMPDALSAIAGAWDATLHKYTQPASYITVFMNHEIPKSQGIVRAHGQTGAFVSQWTIELSTLKVVRGEDLIRRVMTWNNTAKAFQDTTGATRFDRFCSGDLPKQSALYDAASGKGYRGRLYLNAEEASTADGRVFAHVVSGTQKGTSYQLPYLGKARWENALANPATGQQTVVMVLNDDKPGQVYLYVGTKQSSGNPVQRAGLQGGKLYGIKVTDGGPNYGGGAVLTENAGAINGRFTVVDVSGAALGTADALETQSDAGGVTQFARPEDGAWDTLDSRTFYFNATGMLGQSARLYRLHFDGTGWPASGTIELVVDSASLTGKDGQRARSFDNIAVSANGTIMVEEDAGSEAYLGKTWKINRANPLAAVQVLQSNPAFFAYGGSNFDTTTEESSGIIDVTSLVRPAPWFVSTRRYYLANMMDHLSSTDPELVQGGQLYLVSGPK